jgi:hypothetical protein
VQNVLFVVFFVFLICLANGAEVRVVHASPDAPAVDVLVNGTNVRELTNLAFGQVSRYVFLPPGVWNVKVVPTGATSPVVINADLVLDLLTPYTVAAANRLAQITPVVLTDDLRRPDSGKAAVRFVHLSPDAPAVDIAVKGGPTLFTKVTFKTATQYLQVDPDSYTLQVKVSGTDTVVLEVPATLEDRRIYSVYAEGFAASSPALKAVFSLDL